jgi:thymidylate kinase
MYVKGLESMTGPVRDRQRVIVEFVGLNGVGKSTLAPLVVRELRKRGVPAGQSPTRRSAANVVMVGRAAYAWLSVCAWLGPRRLRRANREGFPRRLWRYLLRMERFGRLDGVQVVDGGVTRLLMTLHMTEAHSDLLAAWRGLAARVPMPDRIVWIDASDEDIALRRAARAKATDLRVPRPTRAEHDALRSLRLVIAEIDGASAAPRFVMVMNGRGSEERVAAAIVDAVVDGLTGSSRAVGGPVASPTRIGMLG